MKNHKQVYDSLYREGSRETLGGYEYARWHALLHLITKVLKLRNINTLLDYGCGNGLYIDLWKRAFQTSEMYFCDVSSVAIEQLKDRYPEFSSNVAVVRDNRAPFEDNFFDVILSVEVMEHVEDLDAYLNDIHRLLKPGGTFIWTTPCGNILSVEHIYSLLTCQIEETREGYRRWKWEHPTHVRRLKSSEINGKLQRAGFGDIGFRFRAHLFSFLCSCPARFSFFDTYLYRGPLRRLAEKLMLLDYYLFRRLPNGASMIGFAEKA
jgi:SAM-dependent methyltransferase